MCIRDSINIVFKNFIRIFLLGKSASALLITTFSVDGRRMICQAAFSHPPVYLTFCGQRNQIDHLWNCCWLSSSLFLSYLCNGAVSFTSGPTNVPCLTNCPRTVSYTHLDVYKRQGGHLLTDGNTDSGNLNLW